MIDFDDRNRNGEPVLVVSELTKVYPGRPPTTAVDRLSFALGRREVLGLLADAKDRGTSIILISHDLSVVRAICDRVVVMRGGAVVETGDCEKLFTQPRSDYTRTLIDAIPLPEIDPNWLGSIAGRPV